MIKTKKYVSIQKLKIPFKKHKFEKPILTTSNIIGFHQIWTNAVR
jgi:hypothetical protein